MRPALFSIGRELPSLASGALWCGAFLLPLLLWCAVSYLPWIWHPLVLIRDPGANADYGVGSRVPAAAFATAVEQARHAGLAPPRGEPVNPVFLPAPHEVARALWTGFTTPPLRRGDPWLHQSLWRSIQVILWGFLISIAAGLPLGVMCGAIPAVSRLSEPFVDFIRYMPAPAFGALCVAVLGIEDAPKIAIIVIGTFFQAVLVFANTVRNVDRSLIEAGRTLGARGRRLLLKVVVPAAMPSLYTDMRVLLGWAWTYLIVAELIGASSGISWFINQQGKYRNYDLVFAGIVMIGVIGLVTDQFLAWAGRAMFPHAGRAPSAATVVIWRIATWPLRLLWHGVTLCAEQVQRIDAGVIAERDARIAARRKESTG